MDGQYPFSETSSSGLDGKITLEEIAETRRRGIQYNLGIAKYLSAIERNESRLRIIAQRDDSIGLCAQEFLDSYSSLMRQLIHGGDEFEYSEHGFS